MKVKIISTVEFAFDVKQAGNDLVTLNSAGVIAEATEEQLARWRRVIQEHARVQQELKVLERTVLEKIRANADIDSDPIPLEV